MIAVVYSYYKHKKNLQFFVENGIESPKFEVYFVINGGEIPDLLLGLPEHIHILKRPNYGRDFAAYSHALAKLNFKKYDSVIFMNDTVIGPFTPRYVDSKLWPEMFSSNLNETVKIVGLTINYCMQDKVCDVPHVQTMVFALDFTGIQLAIKNHIFDLELCDDPKGPMHVSTLKSKRDYINKFEIELSNIITKNGHSLFGLNLAENKRFKSNDLHKPRRQDGITLNPLETIFVKTERLKRDKVLSKYISWSSPNNEHKPTSTYVNVGILSVIIYIFLVMLGWIYYAKIVRIGLSMQAQISALCFAIASLIVPFFGIAPPIIYAVNPQ